MSVKSRSYFSVLKCSILPDQSRKSWGQIKGNLPLLLLLEDPHFIWKGHKPGNLTSGLAHPPFFPFVLLSLFPLLIAGPCRGLAPSPSDQSSSWNGWADTSAQDMGWSSLQDKLCAKLGGTDYKINEQFIHLTITDWAPAMHQILLKAKQTKNPTLMELGRNK